MIIKERLHRVDCSAAPERRTAAIERRLAPLGHNRAHDISPRFAARPTAAQRRPHRAPPAAAPRRRAGARKLAAGRSAPCCGCWRCWRWSRTIRRDAGVLHLGQRRGVHNKAGLLGAWLSDLALFLFGYSAWWLPVVGAARLAVVRWRAGCAATTPADAHGTRPRWLFWVGLACCCAASCALEWTRLYRCEGRLPAAMPAACSATCSVRCRASGSASPARACCGSPRWWPACRWRCASRGCALAERIGAWHRRACASAARSARARRGHPPRRARAARARAGGRGRAPGDRGPRCRS